MDIIKIDDTEMKVTPMEECVQFFVIQRDKNGNPIGRLDLHLGDYITIHEYDYFE